jgi:hypothetical protein
MSFEKKIMELKELQKRKNLFLFGFENPEKDVYEKILKVVSYLFDGNSTIEGINYQIKNGWLYVYGKQLNKEKVIQLNFKPHKEGYVKKLFTEKNKFIFKIN